MNEKKITKRVHELQMEGKRDRSRRCKRCFDEVENPCSTMSLEPRDWKVKSIDGKQWRDFVNDTNAHMNVDSTTKHTFGAKY